MAETRKPGERGSLVDGAERFDRLARIVKDNQLSRTRTGPRPPATETFTLSPEDAWAKKYMTQCIGPICFDLAAEPPVFAKFTAPPVTSAQSLGFRATGPQKAPSLPPRPREAPQRASAAPIGAAIGKPFRAHSWLGRLFGR
ncbi:MAG: hypothetical protein WCA78_11190 [Rhizomicrobium sp.]|jgi:hypothetical protein